MHVKLYCCQLPGEDNTEFPSNKLNPIKEVMFLYAAETDIPEFIDIGFPVVRE